MKSETHSNLHEHRKDRKVFLCSIFFFALSLVSASDDEQQSFRCGRRRHDMCDELGSLRTEVDVNTADRKKWSRHFQFVQRFHRSWEDEVASVATRIIEGLSPAGDPKLTNELLNDNRHLRSEMVALQRKLDALEAAALDLRSELEIERAARYKIENEVKKALPSFFDSLPPNITENLGELKHTLGGLARKVESLESQRSATVGEIEKQSDGMKKLQSSLSKLRSATLMAAHILRTDAPSSMADEIIKELNEPLDDTSGDLERDLPHPFPFRNFSAENSNSKALDEMNFKLEQLQSNMKILTDSIGKAMSNIKVLENKYNEALRTQVRPDRRKRPGPNYEFMENHQKPVDKRPFDPRRDP